FAHGFLAVTDRALVTYKCSDYYEPRLERAVAWNDPQLAIEWPLEGHAPLLSDRDAAAPLLAEAQLHE
ncbi:MAG TPA: dTDP-4-dehydrorhamnose 3,5-epimerase family protein, partial [Longimicrobiales bacterium]|nr:dTDP-4-dehydrorhamnose 3,5-epimerase family protein [Longimicrobiales bacterium]